MYFLRLQLNTNTNIVVIHIKAMLKRGEENKKIKNS